MLNTLLFRGLTADEQHLLLINRKWFKPITFGPNDPLVQRGDPANSLFVILQGEAMVVITPEIKKTLQAGDVFGEVGYFAPHSLRTASVHALDDLHVAEMPYTAIREIARTKPSLALRLLENMGYLVAQKLTEADERARAESKERASNDFDLGILAAIRRALGAG